PPRPISRRMWNRPNRNSLVPSAGPTPGWPCKTVRPSLSPPWGGVRASGAPVPPWASATSWASNNLSSRSSAGSLDGERFMGSAPAPALTAPALSARACALPPRCAQPDGDFLEGPLLVAAQPDRLVVVLGEPLQRSLQRHLFPAPLGELVGRLSALRLNGLRRAPGSRPAPAGANP